MSSEDDSPRQPRFDRGMALTFGVFFILACGFAYGSHRVAAQPWHTVLVVMAALTGLYAVYLLVIVVGVIVAVLALSRRDRDRCARFLGHWPWVVWPPVVILGLAWPLLAELAGYDGSEWLWQGISVYGGIIVILAIFFRRGR